MVGTRTPPTRRRSARFALRYAATESSRRPALGCIIAQDGPGQLPIEVSERNFFAELKRRNVYKVAIAYVVVSWLLIQAASIFFPAFDAPPWVMKIFIIVIIFGFPVAVIFSWAFEITPEGIKLESEIEPNKSVTRRTGRKIVAMTIALAVVAAGLFVYQMVGIPQRREAVRSEDTTEGGRRSAASLLITNKSIAVLPFDNLSRDPDNAFV